MNDTDNEWETGIGYLSASTTLVRETVLDNHSGTTTAVNFTTAPSLFCSGAETTLMPSLGYVTANTLLASQHLSTGLDYYTATTDQIVYTPYYYGAANAVDAFVVSCTTALGTKIRIGLYENVDGRPGDLIVSSTDITPSVAILEQSFTAINLPVGWYFMALVCDGASVFRCAKTNGAAIGTPFGERDDGNSFNLRRCHLTETSASWTSLPSTATPTIPSNCYIQPPRILMRCV